MKAELVYHRFEHHAQLVFKGAYTKDPLKNALANAGWVLEFNPRERLKNPRPTDWTDVFLPQDEIGLPRIEDIKKLLLALNKVQKKFTSLRISGPREVSFLELQTYGKDKDGWFQGTTEKSVATVKTSKKKKRHMR